MIWVAWNNGSHRPSGAGYGFKVDSADRDRFFQKDWGTVSVALPDQDGSHTVEVNIDKDSFWGLRCRELIHRDIGRWLRRNGHAPWPMGSPPRLEVEIAGERRFAVGRLIDS